MRSVTPIAVAAFAAVVTASCSKDRPAPSAPGEGSPPAAVTAVVITPGSGSLAVGDSMQFTAAATDASGAVRPGYSTTWSSPDSALVAISQQGWVLARGAGTAHVVATISGKVDTVVLTITTRDALPRISPDAMIVDSTKATLLPDSAAQAGGEFRFGVSPEAPSFKPGMVIVGAQGGGFLRRVVSVAVNDGIATMQTAPAVLTDVIEEGTFGGTVPISLGTRRASGARPDGAATAHLIGQPVLERALVGVSLRAAGITFDNVTLTDKQFCNPTAPQVCSRITARIQSGSIRFDHALDAGGQIHAFKPSEFHFMASGTLGLDATTSVTISGSYTPPPLSIRLGTYSSAVYLGSIGPVPIVGMVQTDIIATMEIDASATADMRSGFASSATLTAGARFDNGDWSSTAVGTRFFQGEPVTGAVNGRANARLTVHPELHVSLYGVAGPFIKLGPYARVNVTADGSTHEVTLEGYYGLDADVGAEASVMGIDKDAAWHTVLVPDTRYYSHVVHTTEDSSVASVIVSPATVTLDVGNTLSLAAALVDAGGRALTGRAVTWSSSNGAVASVDPSTGVVTGIAVGGPITITAESEGQRGAARVVVTGGTGTGFVAIFAGPFASCGITAQSTAYCWGYNFYFALGNGSSANSFTPVLVHGGRKFVEMALGAWHTCGLTPANETYCWGGNAQGQLGDGTADFSRTPVLVSDGHAFVQLVAGANHTCGRTADGATYCWGDNQGGEMGNGLHTYASFEPTLVSGAQAFVELTAGVDHTCGRTAPGVVYCWGVNHYGELGSGEEGYRAPVLVSNSLRFVEVAAGAWHTCGRTTTGATYCWGDNSHGQFGRGTHAFGGHPEPLPVSGGHSFVKLASGSSHMCGLTTAGAAYCWGGNSSGQLGDGTLTRRLAPVPVSGGLTFVGLAARRDHTCGRTVDGDTYCWGDNSYGVLGDGTHEDRSTPTAVRMP